MSESKEPSARQRVTCITSAVVPLPVDDVDTDQIIPATFLKTTSREGLGKGLFAGWRADPEGPAANLDDPRRQGSQVLLAGANFGCGSSREHAAWALIEGGFRAVLSVKLADIFRANALGNGLLAVEVPESVAERLFAVTSSDPKAEVTLDLEARCLLLPWAEQVSFEVDPFARECLLAGVDTLGWLLDRLGEVERWEDESPLELDTRRALEAAP